MKSSKATWIMNARARANTVRNKAKMLASIRRQSPFHGLSQDEAQAKFERMLGSAHRFEAGAEYRQPEPLGPLRVEYDEDGVPTYLED